MMLVTLEQAKNHLRVDSFDEDSDINLKILAASGAIRRYLGDDGILYQQAEDSDGEYQTDSDGDPVYDEDDDGNYIIRYEVQAACLLFIGELYLSREGMMQNTTAGNMPPAVVSLLNQLRDPTFS